MDELGEIILHAIGGWASLSDHSTSPAHANFVNSDTLTSSSSTAPYDTDYLERMHRLVNNIDSEFVQRYFILKLPYSSSIQSKNDWVIPHVLLVSGVDPPFPNRLLIIVLQVD